MVGTGRLRRVVVRRLLQGALAILLVATLTFLMVEALPGDAAIRIAAARYGAEWTGAAQIEAVRAELGLDRPAMLRWVDWIGALVSGDSGRSVVTHNPVWQDLTPRIARTAQLVMIAWPLACTLGLAVGLSLGSRDSRWAEGASTILAAIGAATPSYVAGLGLAVVFAIGLGWLPVAGHGSPAHLVLPAATLALLGGLRLGRVAAVAVALAVRHPSVAFARWKGMPEWFVRAVHVVPLAAPTFVPYAFLHLATLVEGAAVVETVFAYPGLGRFLVESVLAQDVPVIQAAAASIALAVVICNGAADLLVAWLDPRVADR